MPPVISWTVIKTVYGGFSLGMYDSIAGTEGELDVLRSHLTRGTHLSISHYKCPDLPEGRMRRAEDY